jgi:predicted transposase/invertase (TIGR01784 family)
MILDVDPKVDYAFKHMLGRESTQPILIDVIDSVLNPTPNQRIREIELLNPFNPKERPDDKLSILDIKARDQGGRQFNVEMQMLAFRFCEKRILYYCAKLHQQQFHEGADYLELRPTISISFLDHILFPEVPDYHLRFRLLEEKHRFPLTDDMEFHMLELPKFTKTIAELRSALDVWLYFLRHAAKMDMDALPATVVERPMVVRALEELMVLSQSDMERERYESRRKAQLDYSTGVKVARMEGHTEGRVEGRIEALIEEKIRAIHFCDRLLKREETPLDGLARLSLEELTRLADQLQEQTLKQR